MAVTEWGPPLSPRGWRGRRGAALMRRSGTVVPGASLRSVPRVRSLEPPGGCMEPSPPESDHPRGGTQGSLECVYGPIYIKRENEGRGWPAGALWGRGLSPGVPRKTLLLGGERRHLPLTSGSVPRPTPRLQPASIGDSLGTSSLAPLPWAPLPWAPLPWHLFPRPSLLLPLSA